MSGSIERARRRRKEFGRDKQRFPYVPQDVKGGMKINPGRAKRHLELAAEVAQRAVSKAKVTPEMLERARLELKKRTSPDQ